MKCVNTLLAAGSLFAASGLAQDANAGTTSGAAAAASTALNGYEPAAPSGNNGASTGGNGGAAAPTTTHLGSNNGDPGPSDLPAGVPSANSQGAPANNGASTVHSVAAHLPSSAVYDQPPHVIQLHTSYTIDGTVFVPATACKYYTSFTEPWSGAMTTCAGGGGDAAQAGSTDIPGPSNGGSDGGAVATGPGLPSYGPNAPSTLSSVVAPATTYGGAGAATTHAGESGASTRGGASGASTGAGAAPTHGPEQDPTSLTVRVRLSTSSGDDDDDEDVPHFDILADKSLHPIKDGEGELATEMHVGLLPDTDVDEADADRISCVAFKDKEGTMKVSKPVKMDESGAITNAGAGEEGHDVLVKAVKCGKLEEAA